MKRIRLLPLLLLAALCGHAQPLTQQEVAADFDAFWKTVRDHYAYWDRKATDWEAMGTCFRNELDTVRHRWGFTLFLERALRELYDHHAALNTNTGDSYRLVPTGADLHAAFRGNRAVVLEVRRGYGAEKAGLRPGDELVAVNGRPLPGAVQHLLPRHLGRPDSAAADYALQVLLAGTHNVSRRFTVRRDGKELELEPDAHGNIGTYRYSGPIEARRLPSGIGYIRIANSLGNNDLIPAFDSVLNGLLDTRGLVLDLRETPSGGNTTVARAIMGRLILKEGFYQKHEWPTEEARWGVKRSWVELVSPRGKTYTAPVAVLVGPWTGSMGEGLAIGLDGLRRATVLGSPMAGLLGSIYSYELPHSRIGYSFPAERLYHVDGTPRERFRPVPIPTPQNGRDAAIEKAVQFLLRKK
ncbi:S41 family peptidase [Flaviaesturariibacter amylovorans]|uniref:PDZ domain-containing protein n=1 Tax=Flaviaesturariibacter amylovorans TaxID=1084520 RepID=A0ABP8HFY3_9BACT